MLYLHENKNRFHINGFALRLALKQRLEVTRKWPITKGMKSQTFFDIGQTGSGKTEKKFKITLHCAWPVAEQV